jgi:hypothetical protein
MLQAAGNNKVRQAAVDAQVVDFYVCNMLALQVIFKILHIPFKGLSQKIQKG